MAILWDFHFRTQPSIMFVDYVSNQIRTHWYCHFPSNWLRGPIPHFQTYPSNCYWLIKTHFPGVNAPFLRKPIITSCFFPVNPYSKPISNRTSQYEGIWPSIGWSCDPLYTFSISHNLIIPIEWVIYDHIQWVYPHYNWSNWSIYTHSMDPVKQIVSYYRLYRYPLNGSYTTDWLVLGAKSQHFFTLRQPLAWQPLALGLRSSPLVDSFSPWTLSLSTVSGVRGIELAIGY